MAQTAVKQEPSPATMKAAYEVVAICNNVPFTEANQIRATAESLGVRVISFKDAASGSSTLVVANTGASSNRATEKGLDCVLIGDMFSRGANIDRVRPSLQQGVLVKGRSRVLAR